MAHGEAKRKLAAILSADVAGYSRLMGDDERATLATLDAYRGVFKETIEKHDGRLVDTAGDSVLAAFESVVEAIECAIQVQEDLAGRNALLPETRRMMFRIGVNLGDIIAKDDGTIYGDGVNVAARLESLAEPGGVNISGTAFDQVRGKLKVGFDDLGEQRVKNIDQPVRAYRLSLEIAGAGAKRSTTQGPRLGLIAAAAAVVVVIGGVAIWQAPWRGTAPEGGMDAAVFQAPTGPSIAVLPFTNMSGDREQEYFSDGLTEDIITELARFPLLRVLSRNTTFQYKGQAVDLQKLGRELGVGYVLEGSVRRAGERIRINAQLIDVEDGGHLWAERYDRQFTDIFALQDEITSQIVATLASDHGAIVRAIQKRAVAKSPDQLRAYELVLRARGFLNEFRRDAYFESKQLLRQAIALDPDNVQAHVELAWWTLIGWIIRFEDSAEPPPDVKDAAIKAAELDPTDPRARMVAAFGYFLDKQLARFEQEMAKAFELAPHNAQIVVVMGTLVGFTGQWERGARLVRRAHELDAATAAGWYHSTLFYDHYLKGEYDQALDIIQRHPLKNLSETHLKFIAVHGQLGEQKKALDYWARFVEQQGDYSEERVRGLWRMWNFQERDIDTLIEGFKKAGVFGPGSGLTN